MTGTPTARPEDEVIQSKDEHMATTNGKADFSVADVLVWARTKPADETYDYWCDKCAIGQFLVETGRAISPTMGSADYKDGGRLVAIPRYIDEAAYALGAKKPSFGQLVHRLETLLLTDPISDTWTKADAYLSETVSA